MAGVLKTDPAIERFNLLRENVHTRFRWTRHSIKTAIVGVVAVPVAIWLSASYGLDKIETRVPRKGTPLVKSA
ncbi:hypothetical protein EV122DRAFT_281502 [Schizophyllum commune]|nr:uncharacterized protein SCHCODRAFT_02695281 [Schizophyllum commune H4-8]KAI4518963.1 hypothetical protein K525DRAFT_272160 [Schizophyllum commune Loenen D]KAI5834429.1 hypothetical protein K523DRAFT_369068 [Schizophyllum commune Tattone D]KAI5900018.1 hypothetical protein SCHCODRAFT_02695281 [Schizophyllum commune H4-8]